ncbi:MarR family winged helix-turn-helix transcriptional regulator [Compostimonas suwonensis]|uniref:DNA-binding MarR family transcriptional regulator n=1 Tax=Compostimonas suwonensis TaxID=1048394 RepID=A0A2M9C0C5_9MICO|nr:MarR family transcriptional regulator [Compostimonas suwonensis]PJJ63796.1 DNA-binding MarR family transcriptional regulator [Compostimonas suwonensis]
MTEDGILEDRDALDAILDQWRHERPDLDLESMAVLARITQLAALVNASVERLLSQHGLQGGEFDVLTALRRSGDPFTLTPSELSRMVMMSRAGMTNRLDKLEASGLVQRTLDPIDRRSFRVALTARGREVIDRVLPAHAANLSRLMADLGDEARNALDGHLRVLLRSASASADAASRRLH